MLALNLNAGRPLNVLCLGAHCDDIEIGCGGTILKLAAEKKINELRWVVFTSTSQRRDEASQSAHYFTRNVSKTNIAVLDFQDAVLPNSWMEVKSYLKDMKKGFNPDIVFTHYRSDLHQDHKLINGLTWSTFRNQFILEYEIHKFDGDNGQPNLYTVLDDAIAREKTDAVMKHFPSQRGKHWFEEETFLSLMRFRGVEIASRYAEAFYMRKGQI